jgi:hypothetical protein
MLRFSRASMANYMIKPTSEKSAPKKKTQEKKKNANDNIREARKKYYTIVTFSRSYVVAKEGSVTIVNMRGQIRMRDYSVGCISASE